MTNLFAIPQRRYRRMSAKRPRPSIRRRGMSLLEIMLAAGLLGVLMTVSVQMMRVIGDRQRAAERRAAALQTVQALAEKLGNMPWDQLFDVAEKIEIPQPMRRHLPGARFSVSVNKESEPTLAKRVIVELRWNNPRGQNSAPVRMTTWVFPDAG
jgi:prepilin-type N-terminal cleavage/methylation domain-containing protein